ncbi:MAG: CPBP family intramembrane metalloprotease [Myxococcales bacterium]|nr:CPBP family intramembrane metalloprotease [Myxococcales bacterium]
MAANKKQRKATGSGSEGGRFSRGNLLTSIVLVMPLLIFYEIGVLFSTSMNGADLITSALVKLVGRAGFIWVQLGLVVIMAGLIIYLRRTQQFELKQFLPVLLESGIYAATMGTLIIFVMVDVLHVNPKLAAGALAQSGPFDKLVMSIGAGVHEELVFRLLLMGGLTWFAQKALKMRPWLAVLLALLVSSALFSAAHHWGSMGEAFRIGVFVYRLLAGVIFGLLFRYRSFAIAVYTHALYDIYVMLLH